MGLRGTPGARPPGKKYLILFDPKSYFFWTNNYFFGPTSEVFEPTSDLLVTRALSTI